MRNAASRTFSRTRNSRENTQVTWAVARDLGADYPGLPCGDAGWTFDGFLPEFQVIDSLVVRDYYHAIRDEHSLRTIEHCRAGGAADARARTSHNSGKQ